MVRAWALAARYLLKETSKPGKSSLLLLNEKIGQSQCKVITVLTCIVGRVRLEVRRAAKLAVSGCWLAPKLSGADRWAGS